MNAVPQSAPDQAARDEALDTRRSFIVQAPAGSGKTGLLVQRYLALLAQVEEPEEILAITFTRKATGEMRERVLHALDQARQYAQGKLATPSDAFTQRSLELAQGALQRDQQRGWQLTQHPSRLRILTIDALNASLTRQLPLLSGFGSSPRISDQAEALHRQAARRCLRGDHLEAEQYAAVAGLLAHFDGDYAQAEDELVRMLAQRQQWRLFLHLGGDDRAQLEQALTNELEEQLQALRQALAPWRLLLMQAAQTAAENEQCPSWLERQDWPQGVATELSRWQALSRLLLTAAGEWRKSWDKRSGFPPNTKAIKDELKQAVADMAESELGPQLLALLQRAQKLPGAQYDAEQWHVLADLLQVLRLALGHLQLVFQEQGQVDHAEVALRALQALGDEEAPTDLALKLDYRIRHILVDEFQDTSQPQVVLLQRLTEGWLPDDGRTLFLVGDPMQSIYRFRQAEVGLFLQARRDGLGSIPLHSLTLASNFRSRASLVDWVNRVFSALFPRAPDQSQGTAAENETEEADGLNEEPNGGLSVGQIHYHPSQAARADGSALPAVSVHPLFGERGEWEEREAQQVAELACAALARYQQAGDENAVVAVLVRRRPDLARIIPALRQAGLAFEAVEIESLAGQGVVQDLFALTRAILHRADHSAWLALLRAPWCGLNLADLDQLVSQLRPGRSAADLVSLWTLPARRSALLSALSPAGTQSLERVMDVLVDAHLQRRRLALRDLVERSWRQLGGPASLLEARQRGDADAFFELLESLEESADCADPLVLGERLQQLYARPDPSPAARRLKLMTVHKSKGLEFATVILPGLGVAANQATKGLLLWQERPRRGQRVDLLLGPIQAKGAESDPIQNYLRELEREQEAQEQLRLLYVATTRAREQLHLLGAVKPAKDQDPAELKPAKGSALAALWPQLAGEFEQAWAGLAGLVLRPEQAASSDQAGAPERWLRRLPRGWQLPAPAETVAWPRSGLSVASEAPQVFAWAGMRARHIGTVVHAWLERIALEGLDRWDSARVAAEAPLIRHRLALLGLPEEHLDEAQQRSCNALVKVLADAQGRWILGPHPEAQCEYALNAWLDDRLQTLIIDRTFISDDGTRWIIDYKTSALDEELATQTEAMAAFVEHERQRYLPQLQNYARVLATLQGGAHIRPIRAALYLPLMQCFIELETGLG